QRRQDSRKPDVRVTVGGWLPTTLPQLPDPQAGSALVLGSDGICFERNGQLSGGAFNQIQIYLANGSGSGALADSGGVDVAGITGGNVFEIKVSHNGGVSVTQVQ
ncbi:MAG: hypothetical protein ACYCW6_12385, partial [Candidatus Xenobia bacterium]